VLIFFSLLCLIFPAVILVRSRSDENLATAAEDFSPTRLSSPAAACGKKKSHR
jgi:hypothetical protein